MPTRTSAQRRETARDAHRAAVSLCPTNRVLDRLGERWVGLVLKELEAGPLRHSDLARALAGASQKMLTHTLRELERDGLVRRTVTASVPVRVDYALTPLGESLLPVVHAVTRWAQEHVQEIDAARQAYDAEN
ncbi:DNA-binding transcriptional regulator, HxlR family [Nonomuraea maritima]|uniref:DNA-binding transcriptional regulator, HxlR family n=1 Tax=Nonomuraea maritima TaxID=683260 RepID=A0A1G9FX15_9ACTN|nr:helix-turn-helix domain-containing protein [Nonomuraea maritima]SDK92897.1 DNA-binding transcriptional regulator, HxlR family [Nonomuraea maritima]